MPPRPGSGCPRLDRRATERRRREFEQVGIDYCCGGKATLAAACAKRGLDASTFVTVLDAVPLGEPASAVDAAAMSLSALANHIQHTHHLYVSEELPILLEPLLTGAADFVTGSRRLGTNESPDPVRNLGTRVFAGLVSLLTGQRVTDTSFGFRAMCAEVATGVTLTQPQYQSSELLIGALRRGYRVAERPLTMRPRRHGRSKKGNNLIYGARYARVVLGTWLRERKLPPTRRLRRSPDERHQDRAQHLCR